MEVNISAARSENKSHEQIVLSEADSIAYKPCRCVLSTLLCRSPSKWLPVRNNSLLDMFIKCTLSNLVLGNKQVENPELSALSFPHYDACLMPSIYGESRCTAKLLLRFSTLSNHKRVAHTYAPVIGPCGSHHIISIMIIGSHIAILLLLTLANSLQ